MLKLIIPQAFLLNLYKAKENIATSKVVYIIIEQEMQNIYGLYSGTDTRESNVGL